MLDASSATVAPITISWPDPARPTTVSTPCPNCGGVQPKSLRLSMIFATPGYKLRQNRVLECEACRCSFYETQEPRDYEDPEFLTRGRVPFYLQQGAGLSLITRPLARCRAASGSSYLEVGCGFGFGVDYAQRAKQWTACGIDPGKMAVLGSELLNLSIEARYLSDDEATLRNAFDVVMSAETIEHVSSPGRFIATLRNVLRPGGTLILTTPDAADLNQRTAASALVGLLSPSLHLIFQTAESLRTLLHSHGFRHIVIEKDGHSLVAFASASELDLRDDESQLREEYRTYLEGRSADQTLSPDLLLAFAGRAMQEAVNDVCFDQARRMRERLDQLCATRFGLDLRSLGRHAVEVKGCSLAQLSEAMPLNLGGLLYADAMLLLAEGQSRNDLTEIFEQAALAAETLSCALEELAMSDAMSAATAWRSHAEAALCAAAAGDGNIVERLDRLAAKQPDASEDMSEIRLRAFVGLVNGGHYDLANRLADVLMQARPDWADPEFARILSPAERDAAYCLSVLQVQGSDPAMQDASRRRFARLKMLLETRETLRTPGLYEGVIRGEELAAAKLSAGNPDLNLASPAAVFLPFKQAQVADPADDLALPLTVEHGKQMLCIEQFWREGDGLYLSGWVLAGAEQVDEIEILGRGGPVVAARNPRPDLAKHYPHLPGNGERAGFSAYVPCRLTSDVLEVRISAGGRWHEMAVPMPRGVPIDPLLDSKERNESYQAFETFRREANLSGRHVLEIGSRVVGTTSVGMRARFPDAARFVGMDIHASADVDVVGDAHMLSRLVGEGVFDAIFSVATLEHLAMPWVVAREINRALRKGGLTYHIAPQTWPVHETPNDFWRFTDEGLKILFGPANGFQVIVAGMAERIKLYPYDRAPAHLEMPFAPAYGSAYIVARKIADVDCAAPEGSMLEARSQLYPGKTSEDKKNVLF